MGKQIPLTKVSIEVLEQKLQDPNKRTQKASLDACFKRQDIPLDVIQRWSQQKNMYGGYTPLNAAAMAACCGLPWKAPLDILDRGLNHVNAWVRKYACLACEGRKDIPASYIERWAQSDYSETRMAAMKAITGKSEGDFPIDRKLPVLKNCPDIPWGAVRQGLLDESIDIREEAENAVLYCDDIPESVIMQWANDQNSEVRTAAVKASWHRDDIPVSLFEQLSRDSSKNVRQSVATACRCRTDIPLEVLERGLRDTLWNVYSEAQDTCTKRSIPKDTVSRWAVDKNPNVRIAAMKALLHYNTSDVPWEIIVLALQDHEPSVQSNAAYVCKERHAAIPVETLVAWAQHTHNYVRLMVLEVCKGRDDIPRNIIEEWVKHSDPNIRIAAMAAGLRSYLSRKSDIPWGIVANCLRDSNKEVRDEALFLCNLCKNEIPQELIESWVADSDPRLRVQAMNLCAGRSDVWRYIERCLSDPNKDVREAARQACLG